MRTHLFALLFLVILWSCNSEQKTVTKPEKHSAIFSALGKEVKVYTTADSTNLRLTQNETKVFESAAQTLEAEIAVFVNPNITFQSLLGIGGAITDASAEVFAKIPQEKQLAFLESYYDVNKGIGYTLARTNIHSCDFSSGSYTYVNEGDKELGSFSVEHDKQFRIPMIKRAIEAAGGSLKLYGSPWSPPAYMKTNNHMLKGGKLLPEYYETWALYYTKFIKAYQAEGIPVWGISLQNEPMATQTWESCIYTAEEERDFLKNHLGPVMHREGLADVNIIVWDHNRDLASERASTIFDDTEAAKYAWGIGFHWYETWAGGLPMYENIENINASYPDKNILFTEGCNGPFDAGRYQYWPNAEQYGRSMINDFNNGTVGWTDWNILLDEQGGPNHVANFCFAPVHFDTKTNEIIYTPAYYYIGHFSKFIRPEAKRVSTTTSRSTLMSTSFVNTDGTMATVVMNETSKPVNYKLYIGNQAVTVAIPARAIQTLVY
jgi:glucosylceramidase